jgi:hypothetical protein
LKTQMKPSVASKRRSNNTDSQQASGLQGQRLVPGVSAPTLT